MTLFRYGFVDRQRRQIQSAFRHYLAPDLVNALAANPERLQLGGETRMLSVLDERPLSEMATSITGLSAIGVAAILAETGDPRRFATARALVMA